MKIKFINCEPFSEGLSFLQPEIGYKICENGEFSIKFSECDEDILKVKVSGKTAEIFSKNSVRFFRGLAYAVKAFSENVQSFEKEEHPKFETDGPMFDVSRNSVLNVQTIKRLLNKCALMGLNMFMLYTEDTYEVTEYPYFGHMRGRYSKEEIREIDSYAETLKIELIPCIQCLSHLGAGLQWNFTAGIKDVYDTLLIGEEKTYEFLDTLLRNVSETFKSRRIHVGLDEAFFVGCGEYVEKNHKHIEKIKLISYHVNRVFELCKKYDFEPMMWSDMLLGGGDIQNAGEDGADEEVIRGIPEGMQQISWAYTLGNIEKYRDFLKKQEGFKNLGFCGAVFTYLSYNPSYIQTKQNLCGAVAAIEAGIKDIIISVWNNEAACPLVTSLYGLALYADIDYTGDYPGKECDDFFEFICGVSAEDICALEKADDPAGTGVPSNASRFLMFNDPLCGILDKHVEGVDTRTFYRELLKDFDKEKECDALFAPVFDFYKSILLALEIKADFGVRLKKAYDDKNEKALRLLYDESVEMEKRLINLKEEHRKLWMYYNKAFGFEIYDMYYGSVISRCATLRFQLDKWFSDNNYIIEELREDRLYLWNVENKQHPLAENSFYRFGRYYTANVFAIRYRAHLFG